MSRKRTPWLRSRKLYLFNLGHGVTMLHSVEKIWRKWLEDNYQTHTNDQLAKLAGCPAGKIAYDLAQFGLIRKDHYWRHKFLQEAV